MNQNLKSDPDTQMKGLPRRIVVPRKKQTPKNNTILKVPFQPTLRDYISKSPPIRDTDIFLSKNFPVKFGLRKKFQKDDIPFQLQDEKNRIDIFSNVVIFIVDPKIGIDELIQEEKEKFSKLRASKHIIMFVFDFDDFKENFEGEMRLLKQKIKELGEKHWYRTISIDLPDELYFIISNIYIHQKEGGKQGGRYEI
jgi:hypothetical protein